MSDFFFFLINAQGLNVRCSSRFLIFFSIPVFYFICCFAAVQIVMNELESYFRQITELQLLTKILELFGIFHGNDKLFCQKFKSFNLFLTPVL
jgi:hypothetical protein